MAEGFELVRTVRQHLRRGAALLDEGQLDDALVEVNAALALDAQSLPAQALRDRIERARVVPAQPQLRGASTTAPTKSSSSFVPHGVNAASWRGFEQRIQERRFRALLGTINTSIVAGDAATARLALEEARELRPDAPELATFEARVAAVPVPVPVAMPPSRVWIRAMGAAAMLFVGVSMLLGLEWMRPSPPTGPIAPPAQTAPVLVPAGDMRVQPPVAEPVPMDADDDDSVPAIITPPEPTLRPRGTTGMTGTTPTIDVRDPRPIAVRETNVAPPVLTHPLDTRRAVLEEPVRPLGEVPDDYVTTSPATRAAAMIDAAPTSPTRTSSIDVARPPVQAASIPSTVDTPVPATPQPTAASVVPAAAVSPREESRVEEVLRRYARAYAALDASAAAAVWPTVDEKALARAFKDLSSQNVSFDDCEIDIRGAVANASCHGQASYIGKVGNREPRTESRTWRFELRRDGEAWKIENAEARRIAGTSASYR